MTVAEPASLRLENAPDPHPMEVALGLAGLFESPHHNRRIKTRCLCGRSEFPSNARCPGNCSAVTITTIHVDESGDHLVVHGDVIPGDKSYIWKAPISVFQPHPTDYGWLMHAHGQPILAIEL